MRISTKYRFCFIANPQCASTSLRTMLNKVSDFGSGRRFGEAGMRLSNHLHPIQVRELLRSRGENPDEYFFFSSIRNPWDKMVSRYHYGLRTPDSVWHARAVEAGSFGAFIRNKTILEAAKNTRCEALFFEDGKCLMDDIVMVENFAEDVGRIWEKLSLPPRKLRHSNADSEQKNYQTFYDEEAIEIVGTIFRMDIEVFGYSF